MKTILMLLIMGITTFAAEKCIGDYCGLIEDALKTIKTIEAADLYAAIQKKEKFILLDIRDVMQYERGQIDCDNLKHLDRGHLEFKMNEITKDKNTKIIVYCCTGRRSTLTTKTLGDMGYKNVYSLNGGITNWVDMGYPLFTPYGYMMIDPR